MGTGSNQSEESNHIQSQHTHHTDGRHKHIWSDQVLILWTGIQSVSTNIHSFLEQWEWVSYFRWPFILCFVALAQSLSSFSLFFLQFLIYYLLFIRLIILILTSISLLTYISHIHIALALKKPFACSFDGGHLTIPCSSCLVTQTKWKEWQALRL